MTTPDIFIFAVGGPWDHSIVQNRFDHLLDALAAKSKLHYATSAKEALGLLDGDMQPRGILVVEPGIIHSQYNQLNSRLIEYVHKGGTVVLGGFFASGIAPSNLDKYLQEKWNLQWKTVSRHRTILFLNQGAIYVKGTRLSPSYSQEGLSLANVGRDSAWYFAAERSAPGSSISPADSPGETFVAFARVVGGRLGYIGDVNGEAETEAVILEMFGFGEDVDKSTAN